MMSHDHSHSMGTRGVARPMEMMEHDHECHDHEMSHDERLKMLRQHHKKTL
ncbi:hypothetical protein [Fuerstiella marisgermanici]|uniref:Uncharacterized protein n=1 Tax=Fuerstiella marisgermanici TaxID=1891926 RepID=A0A1P8WDV9_9PLAN|nr:hypothetical protein [Fuerstiella marisgermanici]APZ92253.1 hypothetical protein Fuma_01863 [Fuerstiella marisgermanici]